MPKWSLSNPFSHSLLVVRVLDSTLVLYWGSFKQQKSPKSKKNVALTRLWEGHLFTVWELTHEGRTWPCSPRLGIYTSDDSNYSSMCACLQMTVEEPWVLSRGLQINFSEESNLQMQKPWKIRIDYTYYFSLN